MIIFERKRIVLWYIHESPGLKLKMRERFVSWSRSVSQWPKWLRRQYGKLEICGSSPGYDKKIFLSKIIIYMSIWYKKFKKFSKLMASIFVDVLYWPFYSTDKFLSCVVLSPSQWFFHFGEEIVIAWTHIAGEYGACSRISHCQQHKRSMTAAVWLLALSWRMMVFSTTKCHFPPPSPCNYELFPKVKEPLRGTWYNTWEKLICVIGLSIHNINKLMVYSTFQTFGKRW